MKKTILIILVTIIIGSINGCINDPANSLVFKGNTSSGIEEGFRQQYDDPPDVSVCGGDVVCITEVAFSAKNETICELLPEKNRGQCYGRIGIAKLDESLCDKAGSCLPCQQECYSYIASKKNSSDRCERMVSG